MEKATSLTIVFNSKKTRTDNSYNRLEQYLFALTFKTLPLFAAFCLPIFLSSAFLCTLVSRERDTLKTRRGEKSFMLSISTLLDKDLN